MRVQMLIYYQKQYNNSKLTLIMQSKRDLKKQIHYICGDLVGECLIIGEVCPEDKLDELNQLIVDIAILQESTVSRMNFSFDKTEKNFSTPREFKLARNAFYHRAFSSLHKEFNDALSKIVHRMNNIAGLAKAE